MIYFGENKDYILCECEACKGEMYIERAAVSEEDAYSYHLYVPVKCWCGAVDEYINRAKKSCHIIKRDISALLDLLCRQQNVSNKIGDITAELNKKFEPPSFWQSVGKACLSSLKILLILLGAVIGLEIFFFLISGLIFFFGMIFNMPDLSKAGNELFYHVNIFKGWGGAFLSNFGLPKNYNPLNAQIAGEELVLDYIPYAVTGGIIVAICAFLGVLIVQLVINIGRLTFFASRVVNLKIKISQRSEEYRRQLDDFGAIYKSLTEQIQGNNILPPEYKNINAANSILKIFINNRADTLRDAINLFHEDDFRRRMVEYAKGAYNEARQTRRYTKALYMITSDHNIQVDVKDSREESADTDSEKVAEMLKDALSKIKKPPSQKRLNPPPDENAGVETTIIAPEPETVVVGTHIEDISENSEGLDIFESVPDINNSDSEIAEETGSDITENNADTNIKLELDFDIDEELSAIFSGPQNDNNADNNRDKQDEE